MFILGLFLTLWLIFRHGVQVIVTQSPHEGFAGALAKRVAGWCGWNVVLVVESHGDFEESLFMQRCIRLPSLYRFLMRRVAEFTLEQADVLRAVSHSTRAQLERWVSAKPLVQFPTWTDIDAFFQVESKKMEGNNKEILFASALIPRKGIHHLISAFSVIGQSFPNTRLVIIGREENRSYAAELKASVKDSGLKGRVEFIGEISQVDLAIRMKNACVFVLPTYSEGLPRVVFEAMAVGLPVVASAVSGIPEIVEDANTGLLVPPGDEEALADRLQWVLEHPEEAREVGLRARAFAQCFFSIEAYVEGYRQIFEAADALLRKA